MDRLHLFWAFVAAHCLAAPVGAVVPDFEKDVLPLLKQHCVDCHGPEKQSGGMRFDQRQAPLAGGDSGQPALIPGNADHSQMVRRLESTDKDDWMPPKGPRLSAQAIGLIKDWINSGAVWPESEPAAMANSQPRPQPGSEHWSFQPVGDPQPPEVADSRWAANPIDRFLQARREKENLPPVGDSSAAAWVRRAYYDLTGLPPTAAEAEAFVTEAAKSASAYVKLVDQLLQSPRYGERWGRH